MKEYLYTLTCPIEGVVRYVGRCKTPPKRYKQHIVDFGLKKKTQTAKQLWVKKLRNNLYQPIMDVIREIEIVDDDEGALLEEALLIKHIDTVFNIHMPGKGNGSVENYRKTGKKEAKNRRR